MKKLTIIALALSISTIAVSAHACPGNCKAQSGCKDQAKSEAATSMDSTEKKARMEISQLSTSDKKVNRLGHHGRAKLTRERALKDN